MLEWLLSTAAGIALNELLRPILQDRRQRKEVLNKIAGSREPPVMEAVEEWIVTPGIAAAVISEDDRLVRVAELQLKTALAEHGQSPDDSESLVLTAQHALFETVPATLEVRRARQEIADLRDEVSQHFELLRRDLLARSEVIIDTTSDGTVSPSALIGLPGFLALTQYHIPPEVLCAIGNIYGGRRGLRVVDQIADPIGRRRGLAFLLESASNDLEVMKRGRQLNEELQGLASMEGGSPALDEGSRAQYIHLCATAGLAFARAAPQSSLARAGGRLIEWAGSMAMALSEPVQQAHALGATATAAALTGMERPAPRTVQTWREAAMATAKRVNRTYGESISARAAAARSLARADDSEPFQTRARCEVETLENLTTAAPDAREHRRAIAAVVRVWAFLDLERAQTLALGIDEGPERDSALGDVAVALGHGDALHEATALQGSIETPWERARTLAVVASARATSVEPPTALLDSSATQTVGRALHLASVPPEPHLLVHGLAALAEALGRQGKAGSAHAVMRQLLPIPSGAPMPLHERVHAMIALGETWFTLEESEEGKSLLARAEYHLSQLDLHEQLHARLGVAGAVGNVDHRAARKRCASIATDLDSLTSVMTVDELAHAHAELAGTWGALGAFDDMEGNIDRALEHAKAIEAPDVRDEALRAVIEVLVKLDARSQEAQLLAAAEIRRAEPKAHALAALAQSVHFGDEDFDACLERLQAVLEDVSAAGPHGEITLRVIKILTARGRWSEAEDKATGAKGYRRAPACAAVASAAIKAIQGGASSANAARNLSVQNLGRVGYRSLVRAFDGHCPSWAAAEAVMEGATALVEHLPAERLEGLAKDAGNLVVKAQPLLRKL